MPASVTDETGIEYFDIPNFKFAAGQEIPVRVAYRSFNPTGSRGTVLIPTCYGGRVNSTLNYTTGAFQDYHVVVAAMLGNGESTSPSNDPAFPTGYTLRYQDCVNAHYLLLTEHLGIKQLEVVLGFSMGAQQAYYWAVMHGSGPNPFVRYSIPICGSAKTSGHNYAFLEGPFSALEQSFDYDGGNYRKNNVKPSQGLRAFGRAYAAWLTSPEWFRQELWKSLGAASLRDWLHPPPGEGPFESWDAEDLLVLGRMWQAGDVGEVGGGGDWRKALEGVTAKVLVMPSETDQYFDSVDGEEEVKYLKNGIFAPLPTIWGHIGGGGANEADTVWMDRKIEEFLSDKYVAFASSLRTAIEFVGGTT